MRYLVIYYIGIMPMKTLRTYYSMLENLLN